MDKEICEWEFFTTGYIFGAPTGLYYTSCGTHYNDFSKPGKFCQNCGKTIEITEYKPHHESAISCEKEEK